MTIATVNPSTGVLIQEFPLDDPSVVQQKLAEAQAAFETLRKTSYIDRSNWMRAAADLLDSDAGELGRIITIEMGKPIAQSIAEVHKSANGARYYADHAEEFLADEHLEDPSAVNASKAYAHYEPLGVILAVMPWNYPLWQVMRFAAPALMAGNTGVLKHASNVPQSALYLGMLFERAGFPRGAFHTLLVSADMVQALIEDPRIRAVTLTGSESAGRSVASIAGGQIKKTVLELGGSDPFIVMPSADIERAATVAVAARTINNGQSCIASKRFIVHGDVYEEFSELFASKMKALVVGDPLDASVQVGPVATQSGLDDLRLLVDDAIAKGAEVLVGGDRVDRAGFYFAPMILTHLTDEMRIVTEEAFGPVASLYRANDREDAIRIANQTSFGLSSSVWTSDDTEEAYFIKNLDSGAVFVNGMSASFPELPFGGAKASGFGRELAAEGIKEFLNLKTVWKN